MEKKWNGKEKFYNDKGELISEEEFINGKSSRKKSKFDYLDIDFEYEWYYFFKRNKTSFKKMYLIVFFLQINIIKSYIFIIIRLSFY